jgi:hypothetical protein
MKLVTTEYQLDLLTLNLGRLKKLSALLFYVNWLEFGEGSTSPTTRGFARAFMKVRMGGDSIASQVLKDAEMQILRKLQDLREMLAALISFQRESWKADVRRGVLSRITPPEGEVKREELLRAMRRTFAQTMPSRPWYNALAEEIADEELGPDGPARKERILAQLVVTETEARSAVETAAAPERGGGRETLLEAIRILARPHEDVTLALTVLEENEKLFTEDKRPGGWLSRLFRRRRQRRPVERVYKVQYTEPGAPDSRIETVDFPAFLLEATKKASLLGVLASGSGPAYRRLAATGDEQLAAFVDRQLNDLLLIHRRMEGLNTVFQARAVQEKKTARGIKVELLTIKNGIVKANQRRHEYRDGG